MGLLRAVFGPLRLRKELAAVTAPVGTSAGAAADTLRDQGGAAASPRSEFFRVGVCVHVDHGGFKVGVKRTLLVSFSDPLEFVVVAVQTIPGVDLEGLGLLLEKKLG